MACGAALAGCGGGADGGTGAKEGAPGAKRPAGAAAPKSAVRLIGDGSTAFTGKQPLLPRP
ncbi:hypothetical protein ACFWX4_32835, partial [Streptomyces sp. NPDC059063]